MYRHLIFDLDGTLIDSSEGIVDAVNYSLAKMGASTQTPEAIKPYIGYPLEQMYPHFTDAPYIELYTHFTVRAAETLIASTRALPHVDSVLQKLRDCGFRMAVATTKIKVHVEGIVDKMGWRDYFAAVIGGDEVARFKPDPAIFHEALERLNTSPVESMVVGDTINDVLAAQAVPMAVTAVASPYGNHNELVASKPDHFIEDIRKLLKLLGLDSKTEDQRQKLN